ncbi:hypothetical protein An01g10040 [Aspergillus niger]|uniref:Uncharacterized protein n=2 Tax=Aspergillus niger TaxID=5061 RepID=A2QA34_ASPNC|nr:hypothetical protein An01g10040 [Aspergillus niger]CAK37186.1 hypothetical protein An01g10040 [Aspergillus niger]
MKREKSRVEWQAGVAPRDPEADRYCIRGTGTRISGVGRSEAGNPTDMSAELEEPQHLQSKTPLVFKKVLQL